MFDVSRSVGRGIRDRVQLPLNVGVGNAGHQAINRSLIGGSMAGLAAQGLNVMMGDPDGNDDINVMAAIAAGAGMGAVSGKLGRMNRSRIAKEQMAKEGYANAMFGMNEVMTSDSPLALPGAVSGVPGVNSRVESMFTPMSKGAVGEGYAPTMSSASNLPPLLKQAITPSANHGIPDGIPSGAATISDLGVGVSNVAKTQVPTEIPGGVEVLAATPGTGRLSDAIAGTQAYTVSRTGTGTEIYTGSNAKAGTQAYTQPQLGMGPPKAYNTREEALLARANREAVEGKKKLSQGTELKLAEKRRNKQVAQQMENLIP